MRSLLFCAVILVVFHTFSYSQERGGAGSCAWSKSKLAAKTTVGDPAEDNYDVKYIKFNLSLTNQSIAVKGDVTTVASTVIPSFSAYVFELNNALIVDSVQIDGVTRPVITAGDLRTVDLTSALPVNTTFTVHVFYHGTPVVTGTIFGGIGGINNVVSPSWGTKVTFTQSESYHAKEWWPCKQSLHDKIDSTDMWITVPDSMRAGSNGLLQAVTRIDSSHVRYEWKERYPIDHYLISASVAPYIDYSYYMHFTGSDDSMLVQNYVYPNPATLPAFKRVIDSTAMMIDYLSTLYGRYPFWKEKYGHCMAPLSGGMEHQTMTTLGYFEGSVVAHELGHQWFGDNVTCGSWADIFCNEGFASYTEDLYIEHFWSHTLSIDDIVSKQNNVKSADTGSIYLDDTTSETRIFDTRLSYDKGACMLHMLRFVINNDSIFFQVYKTYQQDFKDRTGTIRDFRDAAKSVLGISANGMNLDTFFNQWAYQQGFPKYSARWNNSGSDVYIQLVQNTSLPASVPMFTTPMELRLHSTAGDTVIRVMNDQSTQFFHFTWSKAMTSLIIDPNKWLLYKLDTVIHDTHLAVDQVAAGEIAIAPNPAKTNWIVTSLPENCELVLTDVSGRLLWQGKNHANTNATIPAATLAPGLYLLRITCGDKINSVYKLVKE